MPATEPVWLTAADVAALNAADVAALNEEIVAATGERFLLRDEGLLSSAVNRARNAWNYEGIEDLPLLAALIIEGIGRNHPFEQGNKRTAFYAGSAFLAMNGVELDLPDEYLFAARIVELFEHRLDAEGLAVVLRPHCIRAR